MNPYVRRLIPAWPDDMNPTKVRSEFVRKRIRCLHCGGYLHAKENATYTTLLSGELIWWHSHPSCTPDPWEEKADGAQYFTYDQPL